MDSEPQAGFPPRVDPRPQDRAWEPLAWPPGPDIVLVGGTVELRLTDPEADAAELFAALDHDSVWAHVAGRPASAADFAANLASTMHANGRVPWTVRLVTPIGDLPAGAVVGTTSYLEVGVAECRLEIGWTTYTPGAWATRVNPECKLLLMQYAFDVAGAGRVQLKTDIRNSRSQRAIARLGARFEGVLRRYQRRADGSIRDSVVFSVTVEDWPDVRAGLKSRLT